MHEHTLFTCMTCTEHLSHTHSHPSPTTSPRQDRSMMLLPTSTGGLCLIAMIPTGRPKAGTRFQVPAFYFWASHYLALQNGNFASQCVWFRGKCSCGWPPRTFPTHFHSFSVRSYVFACWMLPHPQWRPLGGANRCLGRAVMPHGLQLLSIWLWKTLVETQSGNVKEGWNDSQLDTSIALTYSAWIYPAQSDWQPSVTQQSFNGDTNQLTEAEFHLELLYLLTFKHHSYSRHPHFIFTGFEAGKGYYFEWLKSPNFQFNTGWWHCP